MRRPDSPTLPTSHSYICLSGSSLASSSAIGIYSALPPGATTHPAQLHLPLGSSPAFSAAIASARQLFTPISWRATPPYTTLGPLPTPHSYICLWAVHWHPHSSLSSHRFCASPVHPNITAGNTTLEPLPTPHSYICLLGSSPAISAAITSAHHAHPNTILLLVFSKFSLSHPSPHHFIGRGP